MVLCRHKGCGGTVICAHLLPELRCHVSSEDAYDTDITSSLNSSAISRVLPAPSVGAALLSPIIGNVSTKLAKGGSVTPASILLHVVSCRGELYPCETDIRLCEELATGQEVEVDMDNDVLTVLETGKQYNLKPLGEVLQNTLRAHPSFAAHAAARQQDPHQSSSQWGWLSAIAVGAGGSSHRCRRHL
jgi:hypothetical protein